MQTKLQDRRIPSFKHLCRLATEEIIRAPAIDDVEWKERIKATAVDIGYRCPTSRDVYRAIDAVSFVRRRRVSPRPAAATATPVPGDPFPEIPRVRGPADLTALASLCPPTPSHACGSSKPISGRTPLVCNLEVGHAGDHGVRNHGLVLVRWSR